MNRTGGKTPGCGCLIRRASKMNGHISLGSVEQENEKGNSRSENSKSVRSSKVAASVLAKIYPLEYFPS